MNDELPELPIRIGHSSFILHHSSLRMAVFFLLHFPDPYQPLAADSDGGRYPPPRPVEPGLSSPRSPNRFAKANRSAFRAATVQPACGSPFIILCRLRTIHPKSVVRSRIPKNAGGR